jgi:hypothetical protein
VGTSAAARAACADLVDHAPRRVLCLRCYSVRLRRESDRRLHKLQPATAASARSPYHEVTSVPLHVQVEGLDACRARALYQAGLTTPVTIVLAGEQALKEALSAALPRGMQRRKAPAAKGTFEAAQARVHPPSLPKRPCSLCCICLGAHARVVDTHNPCTAPPRGQNVAFS